jgi:hypothetical protein
MSKIVKLGKTVGCAIASYCVIDPVFQFGCGRQAALWNYRAIPDKRDN